MKPLLSYSDLDVQTFVSNQVRHASAKVASLRVDSPNLVSHWFIVISMDVYSPLEKTSPGFLLGLFLARRLFQGAGETGVSFCGGLRFGGRNAGHTSETNREGHPIVPQSNHVSAHMLLSVSFCSKMVVFLLTSLRNHKNWVAAKKKRDTPLCL